MIHQLKLVGSNLADAVVAGDKNYDIRLNDRGYSVGDMIYQSLYDPNKEEYEKHKVSDYLYVISFMSNIECGDGTHKVLGIQKACQSKILIWSLIRKFYKEKTLCQFVCFGVHYENAIIFNIDLSNETAYVNVDGILHYVNMNYVVWISPMSDLSSKSRSVDYLYTDFPNKVCENDFVNSHVYDLYIKRRNQLPVGYKL